MRCQCCLAIKLYPHMETVLGKYEGQHNHMLGDDNCYTPMGCIVQHADLSMKLYQDFSLGIHKYQLMLHTNGAYRATCRFWHQRGVSCDVQVLGMKSYQDFSSGIHKY